MPKIERNISSRSIHHVYNRSVDKQTIFFTDSDYNRFLDKIEQYKVKYNVELLVFAILPNHFHFLIKEPDSTPGVEKGVEKSGIVEFIRCLTNAYAKYFNIKYGRSGSLFESRFKSKLVSDDEYFNQLVFYITHNPVKHGLVDKIDEWDYVFNTRC